MEVLMAVLFGAQCPVLSRLAFAANDPPDVKLIHQKSYGTTPVESSESSPVVQKHSPHL